MFHSFLTFDIENDISNNILWQFWKTGSPYPQDLLFLLFVIVEFLFCCLVPFMELKVLHSKYLLYVVAEVSA